MGLLENVPSGKPISDLLLRAAPPYFISTMGFMGIEYQKWVYIVTTIYTLLLFLRMVPATISCCCCLWRNGKCEHTCRQRHAQLPGEPGDDDRGDRA